MKLTTVFTLIFLASCINLQDNSRDIVGKWQCYHRELEDGTTKSVDLFSGKEFEYTCDRLILELKQNLTGTESLNGLNFQYRLHDSILSLGNRKYIVEKLTKAELVLRDYDSEGLRITTFRNKFKKVE